MPHHQATDSAVPPGRGDLGD